MQDKDSKKQKHSELSLGLEELLELAKSVETEPQVTTQGETKLSKAHKLYQAEQYEELGSYCESYIGGTGDSDADSLNTDALNSGITVQLKLYWILVKLKSNAIPASVLLGSFEEAIQSLPTHAVVDASLMQDLKDTFEQRLQTPLLASSVSHVQHERGPSSTKSRDKIESLISESSVLDNEQQSVDQKALISKKIPAVSIKNLLLFIVFLIVVIAILLTQLTHKEATINKNIFSPEVVSSLETNNIVLPQLTPLAPPSALDAVLFDMKSNSKSAATSTMPSETPEVDHTPLPLAPKVTIAPQVTVDTRKNINTNEPTEPEEITSIRNNPRIENDVDESEEKGERRIVDGGVALPPQFKKFSESRFYIIRRETSVRSDPSIRSEAYAGLKKGIRVEVIGQEGYWLRIRSRSGRVGFILAEDAAIEADWDAQR